MIDMLNMFFSHFLFLFSFSLFGYFIGRARLNNFKFSFRIESFAFNAITGLAILAFFLMVLAFLGFFFPPIIWVLFIAFFIISLFSIGRENFLKFDLLRVIPQNNISKVLVVLFFTLVSLYFILLFYISTYPITEWDAISYHLPVAKEFVSQGKIAVMPFVRFPVHPQLAELFFSLALFLHNAIFANAIQYVMTILLVFLIYSFALRYFSKIVGLLSVSIFLSSPVVTKYAVVPYVEINATLFCFSAFYAMYIWITEKQKNYALLSGILWGLAISLKYYSIPLFLVSFVFAIIFFSREMKPGHIILFLLFSLLIPFPWYLRNWIYSGDWFFPLRQITGIWTPEEVGRHLNYMHNFGMGRSIYAFLLSPINLLFNSEKFQESIGLLVIGLGGLFFIKKWTPVIRFCMIITIVYYIIWFCSFQILRYLFPIFPLLSLLGGWTLVKLGDYLVIKKEWLFGLLIIILLSIGCFNCLKIIRENGPTPVSAKEKSMYIAHKISTYQGIEFLNNLEHNVQTVYSLFDEGSIFYHKNKVIGDWFGLAAYKNVFPYFNKPDLLHRILINYGAKYILINKNKIFKKIDLALFKTPLFKLIYNDKFVYIFQLF